MSEPIRVKVKCERCKRVWHEIDIVEFDPPWIKNNIGLVDPVGECPVCEGYYCYPIRSEVDA